MTDTSRHGPAAPKNNPAADRPEAERDRVPPPTDREPPDPEGVAHDRGADSTVVRRDIDPDSAESEVDRNDTVAGD